MKQMELSLVITGEDAFDGEILSNGVLNTTNNAFFKQFYETVAKTGVVLSEDDVNTFNEALRNALYLFVDTCDARNEEMDYPSAPIKVCLRHPAHGDDLITLYVQFFQRPVKRVKSKPHAYRPDVNFYGVVWTDVNDLSCFLPQVDD